MAYSRRRSTTRSRGGYSRRSAGRSYSWRAPVRRSARRAARRSTARRSGGQTVRLVIEHATGSAQSVDAMMHPQVESTTKKSKF